MGVQVTVPARPLWTDSGIDVEVGETLTFNAHGQWKDWIFDATAKGYSRWYLEPFSPFKRVKGAPLFALVGALDKNLFTAFVIGECRAYTFPSAGRLYFFANDVKWAYGNNTGQIELTIR